MLDVGGFILLYLLTGCATGFVALFASRKVRRDIEGGKYLETVAGVLLWPVVWLGCLIVLGVYLGKSIGRKMGG